MSRILLGLTLCIFTNVSIAASDPQCAEYDRLRNQRDTGLGTKNFKQYCDALAGMIKLMPLTPPAPARLQCEYKAPGMTTQAWLGIRSSVIEGMQDTFNQHCK